MRFLTFEPGFDHKVTLGHVFHLGLSFDSKATSKISDEPQHKGTGHRVSASAESNAQLKLSMSFLNKSEFINPVDKQIAEIFMINAGLNELSNGSNKSSNGLHRSGSDRKHTWLQDLNEDDGGQYLDDLGESPDEKSINRDSIGGEWSSWLLSNLSRGQYFFNSSTKQTISTRRM